MTTHIEAKQILERAVPGIHPADSLLTRIIGSMETQYGDGWGHGLSNAGQGSNNWGAVTKGSWKGDTFTHRDSRWDEDQQRQVTYSTQFRWYPTPEAGAADLYGLLTTGSRHGEASVLARAGRWDEISRAIGPLGSYYYAGFGPPEEATEKHRTSFLARKAEIMAETGENPDAPGPPSMGGDKPKPQTSSSSSGLVSVVGLGLVLVALWRISVAVAKTDSSA
jgi:hypothetical protein